MMTYELENGLTLGGAENWLTQHHVKADDGEAIARLSVVLEWDTTVGEEASQLGATAATEKSKGLNPRMLAPVVRGAPYISMEYEHATPQIFGQRMLSAKPLADGVSVMTCGSKPGEWGPAVAVHNEIQLQFDTSDMTWLVFPSEPAEFSCINIPAPLNPGPPPAPGVVQEAVVTDGALFYLRATKPMRRGMVRVAMANNCTTGQNPQYCDDFQPRDNSAFASLLRSHKDLYPTGKLVVVVVCLCIAPMLYAWCVMTMQESYFCLWWIIFSYFLLFLFAALLLAAMYVAMKIKRIPLPKR